MTYQEALVPMIDEAYDELFRNAERLEGELHYKASEHNRTPMDMLVECVTSPAFLAMVIRDRAMPAEMGEPPADPSLDSIAACRARYDAVKGDLFAAIRDFPGDKLTENIETPWGTFPWRDFMAYAYWNPMYHVGQLGYIQMIHGDTAMDF